MNLNVHYFSKKTYTIPTKCTVTVQLSFQFYFSHSLCLLGLWSSITWIVQARLLLFKMQGMKLFCLSMPSVLLFSL